MSEKLEWLLTAHVGTQKFGLRSVLVKHGLQIDFGRGYASEGIRHNAELRISSCSPH